MQTAVVLAVNIEQYLYQATLVSIRAALRENMSMGSPTRSNTNRAVQPKEKVRCLKFWIKSNSHGQKIHACIFTHVQIILIGLN